MTRCSDTMNLKEGDGGWNLAMWGTECTLLIAEENPADVRLLKRAFREDRLAATFDLATDGEQALEYFARCSEDKHRDPVIIGINLPRGGGRVIERSDTL